MKSLVLVLLLILSVCDIKYRKIPVAVPIGTSIFMIAIRLICKKEIWSFLLSGGCLCVFFLLVNKITKGQIGSGDAFVFLMAGTELGVMKSIGLIYLSFLFAFFAAVFFFFIKKKGKYYEIPFVPFIALSYLVLYLGRLSENFL